MKKKPDVSSFAGAQKDPTNFLEGGAADRVEKPPVLQPPAEPLRPEPTSQKVFRLRWDTVNALKLGAAQQSIASGRRVTEAEIVETLLREHFKLNK